MMNDHCFYFSYSTKPNCSSAVTALCAMGMIIADNRITTAALKEMPKLTEIKLYDGYTCTHMFIDDFNGKLSTFEYFLHTVFDFILE